MNYNEIIKEKFPSCDIEVINNGDFEINKLVEYIGDDIFVRKPKRLLCSRNFIRFLTNPDERGKIYYLSNFNDEDMKLFHAGLLKFCWKSDTKINLFKHANPEMDILGL